MSSDKRKVTLMQTLADPKNRQVASKFFRFTILMIFLPIGFLLACIKTRMVSIEIAAIFAVVLVNIIMGFYAYGAYREDVQETKVPESSTKKTD